MDPIESGSEQVESRNPKMKSKTVSVGHTAAEVEGGGALCGWAAQERLQQSNTAANTISDPEILIIPSFLFPSEVTNKIGGQPSREEFRK